MWRQVKLKEKRNVLEFDLKEVSAKKHKETKQACISFKCIIFAKKYILLLLYSNSKTLTKKKNFIFKVFVFWMYSKTLSRSYIERFVWYNLYDSTSLTVWTSKFIQTWCTNICLIQLLKNRMSSISSNLSEGKKPFAFQVSQCWIILKKNLLQWNELKSDNLFFIRIFYGK